MRNVNRVRPQPGPQSTWREILSDQPDPSPCDSVDAWTVALGVHDQLSQYTKSNTLGYLALP
jgi:hypothetical protein